VRRARLGERQELLGDGLEARQHARHIGVLLHEHVERDDGRDELQQLRLDARRCREREA
jgi:hypothetical protein